MVLRPLSRFAALILLLTTACLLSFAQGQVLPVPLGTRLDLTLNTPLSSQFSQPGDQFTADVADGAYKGAIVHGTVRSVNQSGHFKGSAEILLSFDCIVLRDGRRANFGAEVIQIYLHGDKVGNEGAIESSGQGQYTWLRAGLGSAVGAGLGGFFGRGEGAAIGAVAGGGAGAASKALSKKKQVELQSGAEFEVQVFRS